MTNTSRTPALEEDLHLIASEIVNQASNKFTGQLYISVNMRDGGIGSISVRIDKDLKKNRSKSAKNEH